MNYGTARGALPPTSAELQPGNYSSYPRTNAESWQTSSDTTIWDYLPLLLKHKFLVLTSIAIVGITSALISLRTVPIYQAAGRIAINRENSEALGLKDVGGSSDDSDYDYAVTLDTQVRILQSDALAMQVIQSLGLDKNPNFAPVPPAKTNAPLNSIGLDPNRESQLLGAFRSGLKVATIPRTRIIEIRFESPDPKLAAQIVNTVVNAYIEQNFRTRYETTMKTSEWLSQQISDLQTKMEAAQEKLVQYQKEHGILGLDEKQNIVTSKLDELNKQLTEAQADRISKEAKYRMAQSAEPDMIANVDPSGPVAKLRLQEIDQQTQMAQLNTQLGPSHPKVIALRDELQQTRNMEQAELQKLGTRIRTEYQAAQRREQMLAAALDEQKQAANQLNESAIQYNLLRRDADSTRQLYDGLQQRLKEAGVSAGLRSSNTRIVDSARVPLAPIRPRVSRDIGMGLFLGFIFGIALVFGVEAFDNTVRTSDQVQAISALPVLAIVPMSLRVRSSKDTKKLIAGNVANDKAATESPRAELVTYSRPKSEMAESYRALRTAVLLSALHNAPKVIVITSALPQEGKTTTSINSAVVLAQGGARVLLVDADMRRPAIHKALGIKSGGGLSTMLTGSQAVQPVQYAAIPNLYVIPAGPPPPHPAELLGSNLMQQYIDQWRNQFDHIVIDTPPALSVTDAVVLSVRSDGVMVVIRSGKTTKNALRRTRELLSHVDARVLGVVVNAVDMNSAEHYYYYYGKKGYGSGYYHENKA